MTIQLDPVQPAMLTEVADHDLTALRRCGAEIHLPGEAGYEVARQPWAIAIDQRPAAVAVPADEHEVSAVIRAAAALGLRVAPQGTGHNAGPLGRLDDTVLLRTGKLDQVVVDPVLRRCRVGAGVIWGPVVEAAAPHGLAALHGSSPDVGVAGYSLGGGMGWYARRLGMATNSLTAVELVTADGTFVRTDAEHDPDLFWALRGGGGNFGVVTALEFDLYPIATAYAGALVWDWHEAEPVLERWAAWSEEAPDEVTTSFRILQLPPIEAVPAPLRGRQVVMIDGAVLGEDDDRAAALLSGLRELRPELDMFARMPAAALVRLHGDPEGPTPAVSSHAMLGGLSAASRQAFVAAAGPGSGSTLGMAELRQLGGALGRPHPGGGALSMLDGAYAFFAGALALDPVMAQQGHVDAERVRTALAADLNGRNYLNFAETAVNPATGYPAETYARLSRIRADLDPYGLFRANHAMPHS